MRAAREIHAQRAETADEVLVQLDSIATRDTSALTQLERAGGRLLASGSLTPALQAYLKKQQGLVQQELATRRVLARLAGEEPKPTPPEPAPVAPVARPAAAFAGPLPLPSQRRPRAASPAPEAAADEGPRDEARGETSDGAAPNPAAPVSEASDGDEAAEPEMFASETRAGAAAPRRARKQQRRPGARARVSSRRTTAGAPPNAAEYAHWGATAVVAGGAGGIFARHRARKKPVVESEEAARERRRKERRAAAAARLEQARARRDAQRKLRRRRPKKPAASSESESVSGGDSDDDDEPAAPATAAASPPRGPRRLVVDAATGMVVAEVASEPAAPAPAPVAAAPPEAGPEPPAAAAPAAAPPTFAMRFARRTAAGAVPSPRRRVESPRRPAPGEYDGTPGRSDEAPADDGAAPSPRRPEAPDSPPERQREAPASPRQLAAALPTPELRVELRSRNDGVAVRLRTDAAAASDDDAPARQAQRSWQGGGAATPAEPTAADTDTVRPDALAAERPTPRGAADTRTAAPTPDDALVVPLDECATQAAEADAGADRDATSPPAAEPRSGADAAPSSDDDASARGAAAAPAPQSARDDATTASSSPRPPSAGRTATAAPGPRSESDSDDDMLVPTPRAEPPRPTQRRAAISLSAADAAALASAVAADTVADADGFVGRLRGEKARAPAREEPPRPQEPARGEPTPPAREEQPRPPPPPAGELERRGELCLRAHPDLASLFSKWSVLRGQARTRPNPTDVKLHMTRQWKLYTNYREVMDDYGEVFLADRDGSSEVYQGSPSTLHFRVNSSRPEVFDIVTTVLSDLRDWVELPSDLGLKTTWNLLWTWSRPRVDYDKLLSWQRVNHYPCARHLTRKDLLARAIQRFQGLCERGKYEGYFDITPETLLLPQDWARLVQAFRRKVGSTNLWILKPASSSRGRGITVVDSLEDVTYDQLVVAQSYIPRPMCLGGHKFDLRLYVLVTSFNPLEAWLYEEGFARVATRPFSSDDVSDKFVHLTNASIQRHNATTHELYGPLVGAAEDEAAGTKCTLQYLWRKLEKDRDVVKIREDIDLLILKSLVCAEDRIPHQACAFELFGYDVLLDEDARPWLLEVNASPSMARDTPLDKRVKEQLIRDTVRLVDPRPFDRSAVADVFGRRLAATHQQQPLARDLGALLPAGPPRVIGDAPAAPGRYRRLAPSGRHDAVRRVKRAVCRSS